MSDRSPEEINPLDPLEQESGRNQPEPRPGVVHDPYVALRYRSFLAFLVGRNAATIGEQMLSVGVGWELYVRTHSTIALAMVGLVQAIPVILLALPAGHFADTHNRRSIVRGVDSVVLFACIALAWLSYSHGPVAEFYTCLLLIGLARAVGSPAGGALLPQLVPDEVFPNAVTWNSSSFHIASIAGPGLGGVAIALAHAAWPVYGAAALGEVIFLALLTQVSTPYARPTTSRPADLETLLAGIRFVLDKKIILATITLDLFAVLFGGAVALLPVYAEDILHVGPAGLGWMRAAPSVGALLMAIALAHLPPMKHAGLAMLWAVIGFGVATIIFGVSRSFPLSLAMLFLTGVFDNISVVVRHTLVQVLTPDEMRGRVTAVNNVFISASNDLGAFESGTIAHLLGTVRSVVWGGVGTIVVVILVALAWPQVRAFGALHGGSSEGTTGKGTGEAS